MKVVLQSLVILAIALAPAYGQMISTPIDYGAEDSSVDSAIAPEQHAQADSAPEVQEAQVSFPMLRAAGGLGLVLCLMIGVYFAAKKLVPRFFGKNASEKNLKLIETLAMGDKRSISLIEVANNRFLVGNTPHQINLLSAFPEPASLVSEPETASTGPKERINNESRIPFRNLFEVEKKRSTQYTGNPLPDDIRTKMRQLREALER